MKKTKKNDFSGKVIVFHERRLPEEAVPVGYAALIDAYNLETPIPHKLSAIGGRHKVYEENNWHIYTPRHMPAPSLEGHLVFALKYEGLDLVVLKHLFLTVPKNEIEEFIQSKPTSAYARRVWFLYEWLLEKTLNIPEPDAGTYVDVVDTAIQFAVEGVTSKRHRVRNNLPGTRDFCPLVFRTEKIEKYIDAKLSELAVLAVGKIRKDILARAAAFLLLKDSKSSYAIEGEAPPQDRIQRWGRAIGEAGKTPLDFDELLRLQKIVIGKERFIKLGFRKEDGFVGEHDRETRMPLPEHISARPEDLSSLMHGMIYFDYRYAKKIDAVMASAILAFGFVYIHPFEDGNGRLHRYLIHHVLTQRGFNPPGLVFPVSAAILERIDDYRHVLESYSKRLLPLIEWEPTDKMNVRVLNDTGDFYRYFDATPHVEFLYECVEKTIEIDLPNEADFLLRYDAFKSRIEARIEMPSSTTDLLFSFLKQFNGKLSKRAREKEFSSLEEDEIGYIEMIYEEVFQSDSE